MDNAWVGVIGALGGVIVGAGAEALRARWSFRREKTWAASDEQRRRLEMVYEALEQVRESYGLGVGETIYVIRMGKASGASTRPPKVPWAHLRMLVHLYCPQFISHLEAVERAGPALGGVMGSAVMEQTGDPRRDEPHIDQIMQASRVLTDSVDAMRDAIVESSRTLDAERSALLGGKKDAAAG